MTDNIINVYIIPIPLHSPTIIQLQTFTAPLLSAVAAHQIPTHSLVVKMDNSYFYLGNTNFWFTYYSVQLLSSNHIDFRSFSIQLN